MKKAVVIFTLAALGAHASQQRKPRPAPRQAEFVIQVIEASSSPKARNDAADRVPAELKTLLRYASYGLLDSAFLRGVEGETHRIALDGNLSGEIRFRVRSDAVPPLMDVELQISGPPSPGDRPRAPKLLETDAAVKSGETVVLGASRMRGGENALIVLLTAKLLP